MASGTVQFLIHFLLILFITWVMFWCFSITWNVFVEYKKIEEDAFFSKQYYKHECIDPDEFASDPKKTQQCAKWAKDLDNWNKAWHISIQKVEQELKLCGDVSCIDKYTLGLKETVYWIIIFVITLSVLLFALSFLVCMCTRAFGRADHYHERIYGGSDFMPVASSPQYDRSGYFLKND